MSFTPALSLFIFIFLFILFILFFILYINMILLFFNYLLSFLWFIYIRVFCFLHNINSPRIKLKKKKKLK